MWLMTSDILLGWHVNNKTCNGEKNKHIILSTRLIFVDLETDYNLIYQIL